MNEKARTAGVALCVASAFNANYLDPGSGGLRRPSSAKRA